ncbi:hypothetical protein BJY01DRAFT_214953 [Aspergillus pseudoustus]|uniref:Ketoreductase domain-containing protein n=1 Tax=Aspergillus pseudoustus TaxID=1810923 RepID=A0ABR4JWW9_9EURO
MATEFVLITGCTAGSIGYFLAREFAARGYHVFATARRTTNMGDLASSSERITLLPLDIGSPESISALQEEVRVKSGGKLHFIFHNAGYRSLAMGIEAPYDESVRMMTTNFTGVIELNRVFADMVIAAKGAVVFTSSLSGLMPQPTHAVYCASKAALDLWARILRIEMRPLGVRVVVVHTGGVKTTMSDMSLELDEGKWPTSARSGYIHTLSKASRSRFTIPLSVTTD